LGSLSAAGPDRRLALVCNRFGAGVAGGAEAVMSELGRGLHARGWQIDVITSRARDLYTWKNELPAGESVEEGLRILRFDAVYERATRAERDRLGSLILMRADLSMEDQCRWLNAGVRMPGMHRYLVDHAADYRAIVCAPYGFWTTLVCGEVAPERTVLLPCLHDEPEAYLEIYKALFGGSRGLWFQTQPELDLARRIFSLPSRIEIIGSGIDVPTGYDPEGFRSRHQLTGDFVLFAGRREWGKGWPELLRAMEFANGQLKTSLPLVTCGVGELGSIPSNTRVIDLGYLSEEERSNAMAAATIYVQPSAVESFSRTIMEAWLAGTPVVANAASAVVQWHCSRSKAGLVYNDQYEFTECLRVLMEAPPLRATMARNGSQYVLSNYRWDDVLERVESSIESWL
jgi:glycosyltransferase involved in cell wall biosynthesis